MLDDPLTVEVATRPMAGLSQRRPLDPLDNCSRDVTSTRPLAQGLQEGCA
jgi:hypothetical protein